MHLGSLGTGNKKKKAQELIVVQPRVTLKVQSASQLEEGGKGFRVTRDGPNVSRVMRDGARPKLAA